MKYKSCGCNLCVGACNYFPGLFSPEEAKRAIISGEAKKMMMHTYDVEIFGIVFSSTEALMPAIKYYGGKSHIREFKCGKCVFLSKRNLCKIHESGFKPLECKLANCRKPESSESTHDRVLGMWDSDKGKKTIKLWKEAVKKL